MCDSMRLFSQEEGGSSSDGGREDSDDDYADLPGLADTEGESEDEPSEHESDSEDDLEDPTDESDDDDNEVDGDDEDELEEEESLASKRPLRQSRPPERLGLFCAMKSKVVTEDMPTTGEALKSSDVENWMRAIHEELNSLEQIGTWDVVDRIEVPRDAKILPSNLY
jgi:hypothetical protein